MPKIEIEVKGKKKEYELSEPSFDVRVLAMQKELSVGQGQGFIYAGQIVFDACYMSNQETLAEIKQDSELYSNLCLHASDLIDYYKAELKKN